MTYTFILNGETPAKKNSRLNLSSGKSIPSASFRKWHESALIQVIMQRNRILNFKKATKENPCAIKLTFTHGDMKRRDSDNGTSSILDLLTDSGILEDDSWLIVRNISVFNCYQENSAKCQVEISF